MPVPLKHVFMGSDPIALPLLDWLVGEGSAAAHLLAIYTQPDRPAGRGQKVEAGPIKRWALAHGVPVRQPEKLSEEERAWLAAQQADVALVMAYGHILGEAFIATPRLGSLNLHASLLSKYRGASPIQTAVACGEIETGVALMRIVKKLDAGPVADVERVTVAPLDTALDVERKLAAACVTLLARAWPRLCEGALAFTPQDEAKASYCRRLVKEDGRLDFAAPATTLAARINGFFPWPGCSVEIAGVTVKLGLADAVARVANPGTVAGVGDPGYKVARTEARVSDPGYNISDLGYNTATPGTIIGTDAEGLLVATGDGILRLRKLQRPGGRLLPATEFLRGFPLATGTLLPSQAMPRLVDAKPLR
jgi:methionyl-tRNA formyltransferase